MKKLATVAALGFVTGATAAFIEITMLLVLSGSNAMITPSYYFPAMVIYGLVWTLLALLLGVLLVLVSKSRLFRGFPSGDRILPLAFAVIVCGTFFIIVGGYVNSRVFPSYLDPQSLVFDVLFAIAVLLLTRFLYRRLLRRGAGLTRFLRVWGYSVGCAFAVALGLSFFHGQAEPTGKGGPPPEGSPNVLVLLIDTLRGDHLSCYGYGKPTSPAMDQFASEGAVFLNTYTQASWTKPATASLMTGLYPSTHQTMTMGSGLAESFRILPEVYQEKGYRTAIFTSNNLVSPLFGFDQGVDFFYYGKAQMVRELMFGNVVRTLLRSNQDRKRMVEDWFWSLESSLRFRERVDYDPSAESLNSRFLEWLDEGPDRPYFAYIHYIEPHFPYTPPPPFDTLFTSIEPGTYVQPTQNFGFQPFDRMEPVERDLLEKVLGEYDGEIAYLDHVLGNFFRELERRGVLDRTIVLLTADHGEEFFDHSMWGHGHSLFNEVVKIPLIMRFPAMIPAGTKVTSVAALVDVMPTLLELSGIEGKVETAGKSLLPLLKSKEAESEPRSSYGEVLTGGRKAWFLTDGTYKILRAQKGVLEEIMLFDLRDGDREAHDLSDSLPEVKADFVRKMDKIYQESASKAVAEENMRIDKATEDQLRALGYIQ
jgi:arylsulfatase A-like enzyme